MRIHAKAKPFLKWAGGKTQLLPTLNAYLPKSFESADDITYIEPFVGGGAMLFFLLQNYPAISHAVVNDINSRLIQTYTVVRDHPLELIEVLEKLEADYKELKSNDRQKEFYLEIRKQFNGGGDDPVRMAAQMIFLNRTCFNGLYRENSRGEFNVPFGRYVNPTICDSELIMADSELLGRVEILHGDFSQVKGKIAGYTMAYFDPPYRPLDATSSFNSYVKESFDDAEQVRLKDFFTAMSESGCHVMLSNSDGRCRNPENMFFDRLYSGFIIERVIAKRSINSNPSGRGALTELLIRNYKECQNGQIYE